MKKKKLPFINYDLPHKIKSTTFFCQFFPSTQNNEKIIFLHLLCRAQLRSLGSCTSCDASAKTLPRNLGLEVSFARNLGLEIGQRRFVARTTLATSEGVRGWSRPAATRFSVWWVWPESEMGFDNVGSSRTLEVGTKTTL